MKQDFFKVLAKIGIVLEDMNSANQIFDHYPKTEDSLLDYYKFISEIFNTAVLKMQNPNLQPPA